MYQYEMKIIQHATSFFCLSILSTTKDIEDDLSKQLITPALITSIRKLQFTLADLYRYTQRKINKQLKTSI